MILSIAVSLCPWGDSQFGEEKERTKRPARTLFCQGRSVMPTCLGSVFMMYRSRVKPGHSINNQATRPGILMRLWTEVLPMPYHEVVSWPIESWSIAPRVSASFCNIREDTKDMGLRVQLGIQSASSRVSAPSFPESGVPSLGEAPW